MVDGGAATAGARCSLAILAKAPVPGFAKTRLIPRLGAEGAAALHAILLERTLRAAVDSRLAPVTLWCAPGREAPFFSALDPAGRVSLRDQPSGDLGERMAAAFEEHLAGGGPALLIGTDAPELSAQVLRRAAAALAGGVDALLVPARDGGYAAIGLARLDRTLFSGMPWGGPDVAAITRARVRNLGWILQELGPVRDVDLPGDVDWLLGSGLLAEEERTTVVRHLR